MITLQHPWVLLALASWPLVRALGRTPPTLVHPGAGALGSPPSPGMRVVGRLPGTLRGLAVALSVLALAGPVKRTAAPVVPDGGRPVVVALDVSLSMLARDMDGGSRLDAARDALVSFVRSRPGDRIGLVTFAGTALTRVPPTRDHGFLLATLEAVSVGDLPDGTALGSAIGVAANRLEGQGGDPVLLLVTDGDDNAGSVDPETAARAAAALGVRIHTIGVGSRGVAPTPVLDPAGGLRYESLPVTIDEERLTRLAAIGSGLYFRAADTGELARVHGEIDRLEVPTTAGPLRTVDHPLHGPLVVAALLAVLAEWAVAASRWGRIP